MTMIWPTLVTLAAIALYFWMSLAVAKARVKFKVPAPAMSGNPDFERIFRVQLNTLEWMPIFLPALWLCAFYVDARVAAGLGLVWIVGRIMFMHGYIATPDKRHAGFLVQGIAAFLLWIGALSGVVWSVWQTGF